MPRHLTSGSSAVAPDREAYLAEMELRATFGGAIPSWLTTTIAGILILTYGVQPATRRA